MKKGLGKGLSALMGDINVGELIVKGDSNWDPNYSEISTNSENIIHKLAIESLSAGKFQPRHLFAEETLRELSSSIAKNGIIQPILARKIKDNNYEIIAGERRWRAAQMAGLEFVPVIIKELDDKQALECALIENIQREDLTVIEEAEGYDRLISEFNYTQEELAKRVGKSRSHIANMLRLLTLPIEIKTMINNGSLSMGHARTLIGIDNNIEIANQIIEKGLNVRKTENMIKAINKLGKHKESANSSIKNGRDEDLVTIETSLSAALGMKVKIDDTDNGGIVAIHFHNLEQLDQIIQKLTDRL